MILLRETGLLCENVSGGSAISVHPSRDQHTGPTCLTVATHQPGPEAPTVEPPWQVPEVCVCPRPLGTNFHDSEQVGSTLTVWSEDQIRSSGAEVMPDILQTPENFQGGPTQDTHFASQGASTNSGLSTGENLRGLGASSTLLLINGHPVAPSGNDASFPDFLQVPLSVTARVAMLPDGASGLYGTQAVGGAIEIDTLDHYTRPETYFLGGSVTDGHQENYQFSQTLGRRWQDGSIVVVAELLQWDALPAYERGQDNTARVGFTDPGNLVTLLGTYPIPAGRFAVLDFATLSAGSPHLVNPQFDADILPSQKRWALYSSLDHKFNEVIRLRSYVLWTERYAGESLGAQEVYLDVTHSPFLSRPPSGAVYEEYSLLQDFGAQLASVNVRTLNAAMELHIQLPGHWYLVLSGSDSLDTEAQVATGQVNGIALQASVADPNPSTAFNPLGGQSAASLLASLGAPKLYGTRSEVRSYEIIADGPLFSLGNTRFGGAFGLEARDQAFDWAVSDPATATDLRRLLYAAFSEIQVTPLNVDTVATPYRNLSLSIAGRMERYSDFGSSATPRVGAKWTPFSHVELRGAWARSIRAPDLGDLSRRTDGSFVQNLVGMPVLVWSGGTPTLTVERAITRTAGFAVDSGNDHPMRLSWDLDYFDILNEHRIEQEPLAQNILTDPLYASFVFRDPAASLQEQVCNNSTFIGGTRQTCLQSSVGAVIDLRLRNAGTLWTNGVDTKVGMSFDSGAGTLGLDLRGTYVLHYREATLIGAPLVSALNTESNPIALHLMGTASWILAGLHANLTARYANGYYDNETQPATRVGSWTTMDMRVAYIFQKESAPESRSTEIAFIARNVSDRYPPYSNNVLASTGYDQENGDLSGRVLGLSVRTKW